MKKQLSQIFEHHVFWERLFESLDEYFVVGNETTLCLTGPSSSLAITKFDLQ